MEALPSPEIHHRDDFPLLCCWRNLFRAVEVGVDRGEYSHLFLSRWYLGSLYLGIDPYEPYPEMPWDRSSDKAIAEMRYERYGGRAKLIAGYSQDVAHQLAKSPSVRYSMPYDFVYLDGAHDLGSMLEDLEMWLPMLSDKGVMAGHDWDDENVAHPEVKQAVLKFTSERGLQVYVTCDNPSSWYFYKSGMPGVSWRRIP
jgi:hypothetical protein